MKILVCIDGSEQSSKALEKAAEIMDAERDEITVLNVFDRQKIDLSSIIITPEFVQDARDVLELENEYIKAGQEILERAVKMLAAKNITADQIFAKGHAAETIIKTAESEGYDMVVVSSRGLGGVGRILLGSVSNAVVNNITGCSVLVVK